MAIIDPVEEILKKTTKTLLVPTSSTHQPGATNFPTVIPDRPKFEYAHEDGKRTLW